MPVVTFHRRKGKTFRFSTATAELPSFLLLDQVYVPLIASGARGKTVLEIGDIDAGLISVGQVIGLIIPTCEALIQHMIKQARLITQQCLAQLML